MDTGLGFVQPMFFVGVVEDRNDPRAEGRVRVRAFGVHGSNRDIATEDLPWATLIIGNHDVNFTPPPLNAWVFGFFIDGRDAQQPMILGLIPAQASELVDPATTGWGSVPAENYDRESQGSRPRDLGLSPMSCLATGEFLNETYNDCLEANRVRDIPIAGGCARGHNAVGNGNIWSDDIGETADVGGGIGSRSLSSAGPLLSLLDRVEASGNYNALLGFSERPGRRFSGVAVSNKTVDELIAFSAPGSEYFNFSKDFKRANNIGNPNLASTPMGRYQIVGTTLRSLKGRLNLSGNEVFSPALQDRMFQRLLDDRLAGQSTIEGKVAALRNEWEGFQKVNTQELADAIRLYEAGPPLETDPTRLSEARSDRQDLVDSQRILTEADRIRTQIREKEAKLEELRKDSEPRTEEIQERIEELEQEIEELKEQLAQLNDSSADATEGTANEPYSGYATPSADPACVATWDEPPSGYSARYPYNRVIETASGHSIELDDTPGGERIMIWHHDGSYIQITGTSTTHKNMSDAYYVNDRNHHVYIGGNNIVTIEGDSYVLVKGDKIEEIEGNYKQIVHGNIQIGGAKRIELNGADRTDIRSASLGLESNVENLNIRTGKHIYFDSGETIDMKSKSIRLGAQEDMNVTGIKGLYLQSQEGSMHLKSEGSVYMNPNENLFLKSNEGLVSIESAGAIRFNSTGSSISLNSESTLNFKSKGEMLIQSESGSLNLVSADNMGIESKNMYIRGTENVNIKADGGETNIGASGDITIDSEGGTLFAQASNDVNVKGQNVKIEGSDILNLKGSDEARLNADIVHILGQTVFIDDEVQLASGSGTGADGADPGNEVLTKQIIEPGKQGTAEDDGEPEDATTENSKAEDAATPIGATGGDTTEEDPTSDPTGPAAPPDPSPPDPIDLGNKISDDIVGDQGIGFSGVGDVSGESLGFPVSPESQQPPLPSATPDIPTSANVALEATQSRAINTSQINLIGVFGTPSNPGALVRLANGKIERVRVGDIVPGLGRVSSIVPSDISPSLTAGSTTIRIGE